MGLVVNYLGFYSLLGTNEEPGTLEVITLVVILGLIFAKSRTID